MVTTTTTAGIQSNLLGSSQLEGCQGDFCYFNLHAMQTTASSAVVKKGKDKGRVDYQKALLQAGLLEESTNNNSNSNKAANNDSGKSDLSKPANHRITLKSIIQARQEMPLVHQALDRHMRGEEGLYTLDDNYYDIAVGGKMPSYYHQEVPCCENCYQIYSIVDKARAKAIKTKEKMNNSILNTSASSLSSMKKKKKKKNNGEEELKDEQFLTNSEFESKEDAIDFLDSNLTSHHKALLQNISLGKKRKYSPSSSSVIETTKIEQEEIKKSKEEDLKNLQEAMKSIEGLTKLDVAEIRTMIKPPAAVEVVIEAVMILLTGKHMSFKESYRLLSGGETFLIMLKEFKIDSVNDEKLHLIEAYVDNPLFRPENVLPVSHCASKFCAWVHGIVHAARHRRGLTHYRIDPMTRIAKTSSNATNDSTTAGKGHLKPVTKGKAESSSMLSIQQMRGKIGTPEEELSFVQKLEKMKADKIRQLPKISREEPALGPIGSGSLKGASTGKMDKGGKGHKSYDGSLLESSFSTSLELPKSYKESHKQDSHRNVTSRTLSKFDPRPSPSLLDTISTLDTSQELLGEDGESDQEGVSGYHKTSKKNSKVSKRNKKALEAMQKKATDRLSSQTAIEGSVGLFGKAKDFRCSDGITRMPYIVMGKFSLMVNKCNFIVIHDFFDTYDSTSIFFKPIVQRHEEGCQFLCFNYPGQASTVWPRPTAAEKEHGANEPILNNDWLADRIHELLCYSEESGDFLLSRPFHILAIGNGACIATAFCQKYANHSFYRDSLRSIIAVNGFLYPDAQLSSILHAAHQVIESTPLNRPDIAVSYWSRFIFSEDYLSKVNPNLALNIYTAVSNPITNDGRVKITRGCLAHKDYRGGLSPDINSKPVVTVSSSESGHFASKFQPVQVPIVVLQSTENVLVNASNVDSFLIGRVSKHLWSHMLNTPSEALRNQAYDVNAQWVGKMSTSADTYSKYSTLGKTGLKMLFDSLRNPRGAFVMWVRSGHLIQQEYKAAVLDLVDALACPTDEYVGLNTLPSSSTASGIPTITEDKSPQMSVKLKEKEKKPQVEMVLSLQPSMTSTIESLLSPGSELTKSFMPDLDETIDSIIRSVAAVDQQEDQEEEEQDGENQDFEDADAEEDVRDVPSVSTFSPIAKPPKEEAELKQYWDRKELEKPVSSSLASLPSSSSLIRKDGVMDKSIVADRKQKSEKEWISNIPDLDTAMALEEELRVKQQEYLLLEEKLRKLKESQQLSSPNQSSSSSSSSPSSNPQVNKKIQEEEKLLNQLSTELEKRQKERIFSEKQRRVEMQEIEDKLVEEGIIEPFGGIMSSVSVKGKPSTAASTSSSFILSVTEDDGVEEIEELPISPIRELPPMHYEPPRDLPKVITEGKDIISKLDQMLIDEEEARKRGELTVEEFETVKMQMAERQLERDQLLRQLSAEEVEQLKYDCSIQIQRIIRGFNSRVRVKKLLYQRKLAKEKQRVSVDIQRVIRGFLGRRKYKKIRNIYLTNMKGFYSATQIQRTYRGYADRAYFRKLRRYYSAIKIQRIFRGHLGRLAVKRERHRLYILHKKHYSAAKIQSIWRMKVAKEEYRNLRIHILAVIEIQRIYRGYLGRKRMKRRRLWETTKPGPERIKLGLTFIEESKAAFERQQEEIDALHRAQERAESRISHIHTELKESEKELIVLERELQEIDQIERDLQILTHERNLLNNGIEDASGMPRTAKRGHKEIVMGKESTNENDPMLDRRRRAEAYALEMTIQLKRSEREKKRQELEIEFANVFQEVEKKKKALQRLEISLADMEATRERKDREFQRLQQNLMQLLLEQKQELDELREKGLELETATATTAAAAVATAQKAKEHEKRSHQMFSQTEELMKFQFMSMSLSYFSSLNMLKSLRDMNADTTSAAIALSADASSTAASAAAAANLPSVKKLTLGADDYIEASIRKKKEELLVRFLSIQLFSCLIFFLSCLLGG
jgi:hypothetical protein